MKFVDTKKIILLTLLIILSFINVFGQQSKLILTRTQNSLWMDSLTSSTLPIQIDLIRQRLFADTSIYNLNQHGSNQFINENQKRSSNRKKYNNIAEGRLLFVLADRGKRNSPKWIQGFTCHNWTHSKDVVKFCAFLKKSKVLEIYTMKSNEVKAVFGADAEFGAVCIILRKRKYLKELISLELNKT